jgi:hypothetical protein
LSRFNWRTVVVAGGAGIDKVGGVPGVGKVDKWVGQVKFSGAVEWAE